MIYFRVDANEEIGAGHVMRCITIAKELQRCGQEVIFITADKEPDKLLQLNGLEYLCLDSDWKNPGNELEKIMPIIDKVLDEDRIIVDSYMVTSDYLKTLSDKIKVVYFDDMFESVYDVSMIINYNLYYDMFPYKEAYRNSETKLLLGGKYVPLREQFKISNGLNGGSESNSLQLLLICGGGDKYGVLPDIIRSIKESKHEELENIHINVVLGAYSKERQLIDDQADMYGGITVHYNVENMAELMGKCELAVTAAGTVLYELCAMRIPAVFFCMADNQEQDRQVFEKGLMIYGGDIRKDRETTLNNITNCLLLLVGDKDKRKAMSDSMGKIIDVYGAERIAAEIMKL